MRPSGASGCELLLWCPLLVNTESKRVLHLTRKKPALSRIAYCKRVGLIQKSFGRWQMRKMHTGRTWYPGTGPVRLSQSERSPHGFESASSLQVSVSAFSELVGVELNAFVKYKAVVATNTIPTAILTRDRPPCMPTLRYHTS